MADASKALADWMLGLADDRLVLGHRLSEICGHAPILEEDLALTNIALDLLGQADSILGMLAAGEERSADELAFHRDAREFQNTLLVEMPNGDFAHTMLRQWLFDEWDVLLQAALHNAEHEELAAFAKRAGRDASYHLRHSRMWMLRLGQGTDESHRRLQAALDSLWYLTPELFAECEDHAALIAEGQLPSSRMLRAQWETSVLALLEELALSVPANDIQPVLRGRIGVHSEHLARMLAEMQVLPRTHPGASW